MEFNYYYSNGGSTVHGKVHKYYVIQKLKSGGTGLKISNDLK